VIGPSHNRAKRYRPLPTVTEVVADSSIVTVTPATGVALTLSCAVPWIDPHRFIHSWIRLEGVVIST
jgi:hypothetical protein